MTSRKMHLVAYLKTGPTAMHAGGWRHPEATLGDIFDPQRYERTAQILEAAKFDGAFFADFFGIGETYKGTADTFLRAGGQCSYLDPLAVLPIMGRVTRHLGLMTTISTSFVPPYFIARILASIDMLSAGRVGWNIVTSSSDTEAWNAGLDGIGAHDSRYDRADEVVEACLALWKTWDPDPFVLDKEKGIFADAAKVHYADYKGQWIKSRGPLNTPQSPQGHPVLMQAGASERGRKFGARWGEILFGPTAPISQMRAYYDDMKKRVADEGRDPTQVKILIAITPILGETLSIAEERADYLEKLKDPEYDLAWSSLSVGADLSKHKTIDEVERARGNQGTHGSTSAMAASAAERKVTLAEEAAKTSRKELVGTPSMVADAMQQVFEAGVCDGFIIMPTTFPTAHEQFCRAVVPELQRRGLFRREYVSTTLRDNLANNT
jgi:FMN-dependent oxidoreductase (nitrilotriacetate monooxygenase family)